MRLVPIIHPRPSQTILCQTCHTMTPADTAMADLDAPPMTFLCPICQIQPGTPVIVAFTLFVHDALDLHRESRRLFAAQGGDAATATIRWNMADAVHECFLSRESATPKTLGFRVEAVRAQPGVLPPETGHVNEHWTPGNYTMLMRVVVSNPARLRAALDAFGAPGAFRDRAELLGRAFRAFISSDTPPVDDGYELDGHSLIS